MEPSVLEVDPRSGHEILHGARHHDLAALRDRRDPGARMHGNPGDLAVRDLAFPGMQARTDGDAQLSDTVDDGAGATDRACRPVEDGEKAVAGGVDLAAAESRQLAPDDRVMTLQQLAPGAIPELERLSRRIDDVREQDGREHAVRLGVVPPP